MKKILIIVGTRADAIKMMPVYQSLKKQHGVQTRLLSTGQHRDLLKEVFQSFKVYPDFEFDVMKKGQALSDLVSNILSSVAAFMREEKPDYVLVHGDTATSYAAMLAAFYEKIPIAHVEAGLRTGDLHSPFPEEFHRKTMALTADLHFAPSQEAKSNLLEQGVSRDKVYVVGNTVADAVQKVVASQLKPERNQRPNVLMTMHRRESQEQWLGIMDAIVETAQKLPHVNFEYVFHPNLPRSYLKRYDEIKNLVMNPPLKYGAFLSKLMRADLVLTDSGGIQEESAILNRRVLLLREATEREDGIKEGLVKLVGKDPQLVKQEILRRFSILHCESGIRDQENPSGASEMLSKIVLERLAI